jgi:SAM-dependent methyltransferase
MPVCAEDVRDAYRFILGREPESDDVVVHHQFQAADIESLRLAFFRSDEFRSQAFLGGMPLMAPPQAIETEADSTALRAIIAKTAAAWEALGETAPHFSVLSQERFKPEWFAENERLFFESGKSDLALLFALLRRIGRPPESLGCCLEYGCGVGRVTAHLAAAFSEVIAVDVSTPHLRLTQERMARLGQNNVSFVQVTPDNLHPATGYDLWFSRLVLQHNPPPVTLAILDRTFAGLAPRGVAVVHVPTYCNGYSFNVAHYLADKLPAEHMHMHATPQKPILELAWRHGCCLLDVREEELSGWIMNILVFQKAA